MIKKTLLTILAVLFACFLLAEESAAFLQNIVERISQIESRYHSMKQVIEIDHYKSGKKEKSSKIKVLSLNDKSLIVLLAPENQKGKVILKKGVSNYLYFPKANRYTRVSARSSLFGNVVIGDIAMPPLLESYNYKLLSRKQKGDTLKVVIEFTAKQGKKLAFAKKVCYYRQYKDEPGLLQKVESFTSSDLRFGTSAYFDYRQGLPRKMKVESVLTKGEYSVLKILVRSEYPLKNRYFTTAYLKYAGKL